MKGITGIKIAIGLGTAVFVVRGIMLLNLLLNRQPAEENFPIEAPSDTIPAQQPTEDSDNIAITPTRTGSTSTGTTTDNQPIQVLDIALPTWMLSPGLVEFANQYEEENPNTVINFITGHDTEAFYRETRDKFNSNDVDLALVPSNYGVSFRKFAFDMQTKQDIEGFFHNSFSRFFKDDSVNFIPYALDPLGIISNESVTKTTDTDNILDLYDQFGSKFAFGYDPATITLLQQNQEPYPGYFQAFYSLINDWYNTNDILQFKRFIDKQKDWSIIKRRRDSLVEQRSNSECANYSHICLLGNKKVDAVPGFLSDLVIWDKYLNHTTITSEDVIFNEFPISTPLIKGRGWVINGDSSDIVPAVLFIGSYIAEGVAGNVRLMPNKMLSAFKSIYELQLSQPLYKEHKDYRSNAELIYGSLDWQNLFMTRTSITDVLMGTYNIELFLANPGWEF